MNGNATEGRREKISKVFDAITELYSQRKSQEEIAEKFHISVSQVAKVTQSMGIYHTVKSKPCNALIFLEDFSDLLAARVE